MQVDSFYIFIMARIQMWLMKTYTASQIGKILNDIKIQKFYKRN